MERGGNDIKKAPKCTIYLAKSKKICVYQKKVVPLCAFFMRVRAVHAHYAYKIGKRTNNKIKIINNIYANNQA